MANCKTKPMWSQQQTRTNDKTHTHTTTCWSDRSREMYVPVDELTSLPKVAYNMSDPISAQVCTVTYFKGKVCNICLSSPTLWNCINKWTLPLSFMCWPFSHLNIIHCNFSFIMWEIRTWFHPVFTGFYCYCFYMHLWLHQQNRKVILKVEKAFMF